ncbi:MAG: MBL fold metallo-hydrolase [Prolixibacteraceae bacterium]|nr:MBL fold metallo-hydrolase [Prolixibacteraceae bacterium]
MEITVLIDNYVSRANLLGEHGLSFCIDTGKQIILFDTGASKNFALNASQLGINVALADVLIISHGHHDHTGGLAHFIESNEKAPVYLKKEAFWPKFKYERFIGFNPSINTGLKRFRLLSEVTEVSEGVFVFPVTHSYFENDQHRQYFYTLKNDQLVDDAFDDELFVVVKTDAGLTVLSSCSHKGITNMIETAENHFKLAVINVIGGFHLKDEPMESTRHIIDYFNQKAIRQVYTGHCTGIEKFSEIQTKCKAAVYYHDTGRRIIV